MIRQHKMDWNFLTTIGVPLKILYISLFFYSIIVALIFVRTEFSIWIRILILLILDIIMGGVTMWVAYGDYMEAQNGIKH